ncbi:MAG: DMT family transporter [Asgard group archaeon]|nr:DMT family transporter [Asgard group archaeon]
MAISNYFGELAAIAGAICFGVGNVIIKSQGNKIKPIAINAIRLSFSAIFYFILIMATRKLGTTFSLYWKSALLIVGGTLMGIIIGDVIFYLSQQLIGLSRAYPIALSYPLLTYLIGIIFSFESYNKFRIQGVILVILGVYLVSSSNENQLEKLTNDEYNRTINPYSSITSDEENNKLIWIKKEEKAKRNIILGILGSLTTAVCWTIGTIMMDQGLSEEISGLSANAFRMICIAPVAMSVFLAGNRGKMKSKFSKKGIALVLLAGIIGNTLGSLLYIFALSFSEASTTAAITAASPLIATPLSVIFLKEKVSLLLILGTLLTMCGIWLIILY